MKMMEKKKGVCKFDERAMVEKVAEELFNKMLFYLLIFCGVVGCFVLGVFSLIDSFKTQVVVSALNLTAVNGSALNTINGAANNFVTGEFFVGVLLVLVPVLLAGAYLAD